jgi:uncharacterized membrane protein YphA (DoxX/SURF4 family)
VSGAVFESFASTLTAWFLAAMFLGALYHKVTERLEFVGIVANYRLFPRPWAPAVAWLVMGGELAAAGLLVVSATRPVGALLAIALLGAYTLGIAINLWRDRRDIDCGCGGEPTPLSGWLVVRNLILIGLAAMIAGPAPASALTWSVVLLILASMAVALFVYAAANQLLANIGKRERLWNG